MNWIIKTEFNCIGQVAKHCDWEQLCIYIEEQTNLYILPKIGYCLFNKINNNISDTFIKKLLNGCEFTDSFGNKNIHFGLKRVLIHATYAAYIYRHGFIDTPLGVVQKLNQDSLPTPLNELKGIKNEHYNNAEMYYKMVENFIKCNFDNEIIKDCYNNCSENASENEQQRRQFTFTNIEY